jgi:uncharacterized protein (TIGR02449 family)
MTQSELNTLEQQVDNLLKSFQQLTVENNSLRKKIDHLNNANADLLDQKKKAADSLKKIIERLQDGLLCKTQ